MNSLLFLLYLVLFTQSMDFNEFETLIGKGVWCVDETLLDAGFKHKKLLGVNIYKAEINNRLYGMPYNMISIIDDEVEIVKNVTIHFHCILNDDFYDSFIKDYGNPDTIQVIDGYDSIGKWTENESEEEIEFRVRKVTFKMKEGTFEENPLFMIWNKKDFQIKILLKREQNISEITFRVPTDRLWVYIAV